MTNGDKIPRAKHLEQTAAGAKQYILQQIYDLALAVQNDLPIEFVGATSSSAGRNGLVPQPALGDQGKYLRGDGSWFDVLGIVSSGYQPKISAVSFTLATSAWTLNSNETSEFVYYADITVSGLTAKDYTQVDFTRASQSIIADANVCASCDTMSGKIRIYAENKPTASITGQYVILKGAN